MRSRAWTEPEVDECDDLIPKQTPQLAGKLIRLELPRILNEKVYISQ